MATDIATMTGSRSKEQRDVALWAILVILGVYAAMLAAGWPQHWAELAVGAHAATASEHPAEYTPQDHAAGDDGSHAAAGPAAPELYAVIPFVLLLLAIAVLPLLNATEHWWEENANR
ncbi:MAG: hypothetical protein AAF961_11200, partial [Planctomycetota bacterium]